MFGIILSISTIALVSAGGSTLELRQNFLGVGSLTECDGKDGGNYTITGTFTTAQDCNLSSQETNDDSSLTLIGPHGQRTVNNLKALTVSRYPVGAYGHTEHLYLALSGNLEGKYVYRKLVSLSTDYLKKCSSVLGYSYVSSKSLSILISDWLDISVLISPTGAYEAFKKGCTTVCSGQKYIL